ncbi:anaphase-promoting complex subunit 11 RING-H2 finger-domain-containing protein, partial [Pisolithus croceorrhizus]
VPYEGCCSMCKMPDDDYPLIWGQCNHVFQMHYLLQWLGAPTSKPQCPTDTMGYTPLLFPFCFLTPHALSRRGHVWSLRNERSVVTLGTERVDVPYHRIVRDPSC